METTTDVQDFTNLTCTNLMVKLKILLKAMKKNSQIQFYSTREQSETLAPLSKNKNLKMESKQLEPNKFHISFFKIE
jgi:cytoplasmic iron level regulating protein YaaA (DUF328/UPF0246 family)